MSNTKSPDSDASDHDGDSATAAESPPGQSLPGASLRTVFAVAAGVIVVDQITKIWAAATLDDRTIDLFWTARFHLTHNTGSAFGLGSGLGRWLAVLVIAVVIAVVLYARNISERRTLVLLGGIVGGATGNLIDRVARADDGFLSGGVVDFIDFQWWPIFNVADMAVVLSAIGLTLLSLRDSS